MITRRTLTAGLAAAGVGVALRPGRSRAAEPVTLRMGVLRLIHCITPYFYGRFAPPGVTVEIVPFESPTDCKTAVSTRSVDFGTFGIAAATLGAAMGEPVVVVGTMSNRGMAIIAKKDSGIVALKDLRGKRVGIWPGSTQEVFVRERLRMEGMGVKDIVPVRISFSEMHIALARGDIDAYVGAEPAPSVSLLSGVGTLVEHPYGTEMGALNMVLATNRDFLDAKPELVRAFLAMHRAATELVNKDRDAVVAMATSKLGQKKEAIELSLPNVEYTWRLGPTERKQAHAYAEHMLELHQIKRVPEPASFIDTKFVDAMSAAAL